jgi:hypothetical protein
MDEALSDLEDLFDRAAKLAARVPAQMQATAFGLAVQALGGEGSALQRRSSPARSAAKAAVRPRSTAGRPGPKAAVESLIEKGYLNDPRLVGDIRDHLTARGWKYAPKEIATAVLRLLREGTLRRSRGADGQYHYERAA